MINRRTLVTISSAGIASAALGFHGTSAQGDNSELQLQNASFIRDLSDLPDASPAVVEGTPDASPVAVEGTPDASPVAVEGTPEAALNLEDLHGYILGDPEAPNTLELYSDYRCPHCRSFHTDLEPGLIDDFVSTGRMKIELFDFTVVGVPSFESLGDDTIESVQAAEASACAAEQGEYLAYRDWLFDGELRTSDGDFSDENLIAAAEELGLDADQFAASLLDGVYEDAVIAMVSHGLDRGVSGTPTMILNDGAPFFVPSDGYDGLKELLEEELL